MNIARKITKPELLVPAGNFEKLLVAIHFGADAVYLGGRELSLRANAKNFNFEEMARAIVFAHEKNVKVYVTLNIFAHNDDMDKVPAYLEKLKELKPDGIIASDPGIIFQVRKLLPNTPIHLSTQANTTNWATCEFWEGQGISRLGLARELSLKEIREIRNKTKVELEAFVHGAMCVSYSGRCWMSKFMSARDANRGDCSQSCRWEYFLMESKREGEYFPIEGNERGSYLFNSKDLCLVDSLQDLMEAGVNAFKIEGRMKTTYYVGVVTNVYRAAIDKYFEAPGTYKPDPAWRDELASVSHRGYNSGFIHGPPSEDRLLHTFSPYRSYDFLGIAKGASLGFVKVRVKNKFEIGASVETVGKGMDIQQVRILSIRDQDGNELKTAKSGTDVLIGTDGVPPGENSLIRKKLVMKKTS